jgi:hypothetical protein
MALFRGLGFRKDATRGTTPIEVRKSLAGLFSATGVMPGGPSPLLTGNAAWTYTVHGPAWFVATRGPSDGVALYGNDGDTIIGTTGVGSTVPIAPGAGLQRIDIAWTRHQTAGENGDPAPTVALASEPLFGVESGTAASSSPVAPTIPVGAIELGRNTMTSAATSTSSAGNTITQSAPVAVLRGVTTPNVPTTYTPILAATVTNPTNFVGTGRYIQGLDKLVTYWFNFTAGAGVTAGSGVYNIPLPVPRASAGGLSIAGAGMLVYDASVNAPNFAVSPTGGSGGSVNTATLQYNAGGVLAQVTNASIPWAVGDQIAGCLIYEAA